MDGGKGITSKVFSIDRRDLWIEALLPAEEGMPGPDPILFQADSIDYIRGLGPKNTALRLKSGLELFFSLSPQALMEGLRAPDSQVLDLKPYVCFEKKKELLDRLREEFREAAEAAKFASIENMSFRAFVRTSNKAEFREIAFTGRDIFARKIAEGGSIMGGNNIRLTLRDAEKSPFGVAELLMEGTLAEFRSMCDEAYARGERELDLREYSMRKGTVPAEERAQKAAQQQGRGLQP